MNRSTWTTWRCGNVTHLNYSSRLFSHLHNGIESMLFSEKSEKVNLANSWGTFSSYLLSLWMIALVIAVTLRWGRPCMVVPKDGYYFVECFNPNNVLFFYVGRKRRMNDRRRNTNHDALSWLWTWDPSNPNYRSLLWIPHFKKQLNVLLFLR